MAEQSGAGASDAWLAAHTVYRADLRLYIRVRGRYRLPHTGTARRVPCTGADPPLGPARAAGGRVRRTSEHSEGKESLLNVLQMWVFLAKVVD